MGHDVLYCPKCHTPIMEGHNDWECDRCNLICDASTGFTWKSKAEVKPPEPQRELPQEGEIWRHCSGELNRIIGVGVYGGVNDVPIVVCQSVQQSKIYIYPIEDFMESLKSGFRFSKTSREPLSDLDCFIALYARFGIALEAHKEDDCYLVLLPDSSMVQFDTNGKFVSQTLVG